MVQAEELEFSYPEGTLIFERFNYSFEKGLLHCIIGPSGCGKTTLLYLIAGLLKPSAGTLNVNGSPPVRGREKTAVILQDYGLFPWKKVYENLALGLRIRGVSRREEKLKISRVLSELGLESLTDAYPEKLSGGEKQRLAVGRALVLEPDLLLLDEPFSSLDAITREQLQDRLGQIHGERNMTVVLVTHSIEEAVYLGHSVHVMSQDGTMTSLEGSAQGDRNRSGDHFFSHCREARKLLDRVTGVTGRQR